MRPLTYLRIFVAAPMAFGAGMNLGVLVYAAFTSPWSRLLTGA